MAHKEKTKGDYVKKETMLFIAFITLMTGFLGGVVFGVHRSASIPQFRQAEEDVHR